MRKTVVVFLLILAVCPAFLAAEGVDSRFGLSFGGYGISPAGEIDGGYYLKAGVSLYLASFLKVDLSYFTDLTPIALGDHLAMVDVLFRVVTFGDGENAFVLGPVYACDLAAFSASQSVGFKVIPVCSWNLDFSDEGSNVTMSALPITVLLELSSRRVFAVFGFLEVQVFF